MPKAILVVESQPSDPSREDEYNEWYGGVHLREVCSVPGIVGARRYKLRSKGGVEADPGAPRYVAVYEIDADDVTEPMRELSARSAEGRHTRSDAMQMDPRPTVALYELME